MMAKKHPNLEGHEFQPGESGNPAGRPKGIKNWSTIVQELLDDDKLAEKLLAKKPGWWDLLPNKNAGHAIVTAMMIQALNGDTKAATWLRRTGFGDKLDIQSGGKRIKNVAIFDMRTARAMTLQPIAAAAPKRKAKSKAKADIKKPKSKPAVPKNAAKHKTTNSQKV